MTVVKSEQETHWDTSVSELMATFREILWSIVPHLETVRIPIGVYPGVDSWDEISETLFRHVVIEAIRASLPVEEMDAFRVPAYETDYENYEGMSFIEVLPKDRITPGNHIIFHSFLVSDSGGKQFSEVKCKLIDAEGRLVSDAVEILPFEKTEFRCYYRRGDSVRFLDRLRVIL